MTKEIRDALLYAIRWDAEVRDAIVDMVGDEQRRRAYAAPGRDLLLGHVDHSRVKPSSETA